MIRVNKSQAELCRAQDQLQSCLEEENYTAAAFVQENIAARTRAEPWLQRNRTLEGRLLCDYGHRPRIA